MSKHKLIGYGSLISHKSFHPSSKHSKTITPVIIKGYKRIFNISEKKGKSADILNLVKSKNSKFNGVLFEIDDFELEKLRKREDWYNLEKIDYYDFETKKKLGKAIACIDYFLFIDKKKKLPEKNYFILCREAAYNLSEEFGRMWDETTFTSGNKKISVWIKKHKGYDTLS